MSPPGNHAYAEIALFCASPTEQAALASLLGKPVRIHHGLFQGFTGTLDGRSAVGAVTGGGEYGAYAAVRQIAFLYRPSLMVNFGVASGVAESLHAGDVVVAASSIRYYCPVALADNMFDNDDLIFPSHEFKERIVGAPKVAVPAGLLAAATAATRATQASAAWPVAPFTVRMGSSDGLLLAWRAREFVRRRYGVEAIDTDTYGFLTAAADAGVPALSIKVVCDSCKEDEWQDFARRSRRFLREGAGCVETVARTLLERLAASGESA